MFIDNLLDLIEQDIKIDNRKEVKKELEEAIRDKHFLNINNIGFLTWFEIKGEGTRVFINNLFIKKEHRNKNNLLFLRKLFKNQLYPMVGCYWESRKRKVYVNA